MYLQFNDRNLDSNNVICVQKAIIKLFELLKQILKPQVIKPLYLPALLASRNIQYCLKDSTSLVFIDSNRYKDQDLTFVNTPYHLFNFHLILKHLSSLCSQWPNYLLFLTTRIFVSSYQRRSDCGILA